MEPDATVLPARTSHARTATRGRIAFPQLFPATATLSTRGRWLVHVGFALLTATIVANFLHVAFGVAPSWETAMRGVVPAGVAVVAALILIARAWVERERRLVWILLACAFSSYAIAFVIWGCWLVHLRNVSEPSLADVFWMGMYPLLAAAVVVSGRYYRARGGTHRVALKIWLDGVVAATAMIALIAAFIASPLLQAANRSHVAVVTVLTYPMADMVIGVLMVALLSVRGWRMDRKWWLAIATFAFWLFADCACSTQIIDGAHTGNSGATLAYMVAFTCLAAAAWQSEVHPQTESTHWSALIVPAALTLAAPTILVYDHFNRISLTALVLTWIALLASMLRVAVALRDTMSLRDVQRAALTDDLTQLPNRRMFLATLGNEIEAAARNDRTLTALMLDLDNFKQLNDTLGHDAGDELLRLAGPRLRDAAGPRSLVARLGGDEFAVLLAPNCSLEDAIAQAQAVLDSFAEPLQVYGLTLRLTASVGIACFPQDADDPHALLKRADVAMYEAKRSRRGWECYSADRDVNTLERLEMSGELAAALDGDEIEVVFQPIADTDTRRVRAAEALVRWRRPDGTLRPPSEFLEAAELAGLSRQLTRRVLKLSLDNVCAWRAEGHRVAVSVNATVSDLLDERFPDEVAAALAARGLDGNALTIEVTESSIMANPARVGDVLGRLRELGVRIALDDFGTGYSSLTHLRQLPVDRLKIDRSFVTRMLHEQTDAAIVYATIELAHRLNLLVIAEGVEDEQTWQALLDLGCDSVQGYAIGRPVEPVDFRARLEAARAPHFADSQSVPTPASTASGGSIA